MSERPILFSGEMVRAILDGRKTQTRRVVSLDRIKVRARERVTADWPGIFDPHGFLVCEAGTTYPAHLSRLGAVSAVTPGGKLGLKPGEFDFVCPYASGNTVLTVDGERQTWRVLSAGDRLWVRETWAGVVPGGNCDEITGAPATWWSGWQNGHVVRYQADREALWDANAELRGFRWRPSIHMPRWASRITLEVTDVRVERVQEISEADAVAEGVTEIGGQFAGCYSAPDGSMSGTTARDAFARLWDSLNAKRGHPWEANPWVRVVSFRDVSERVER